MIKKLKNAQNVSLLDISLSGFVAWFAWKINSGVFDYAVWIVPVMFVVGIFIFRSAVSQRLRLDFAKNKLFASFLVIYAATLFFLMAVMSFQAIVLGVVLILITSCNKNVDRMVNQFLEQFWYSKPMMSAYVGFVFSTLFSWMFSWNSGIIFVGFFVFFLGILQWSDE